MTMMRCLFDVAIDDAVVMRRCLMIRCGAIRGTATR